MLADARFTDNKRIHTCKCSMNVDDDNTEWQITVSLKYTLKTATEQVPYWYVVASCTLICKWLLKSRTESATNTA